MIPYRQQPSFDGISLLPVRMEQTFERSVMQHRPARGDGAQLCDRGRAPWRVSLEGELAGTPEAILQDRTRLTQLAATGAARTFVHPWDGSWSARLVRLSESVDRTTSRISIELLEDVPFTQRQEPIGVGLVDVERVADEWDTSVGTLGLELQPSGARIKGLAASWSRDTATEQIERDISSVRAELNASRATLDDHNDALALRAQRLAGSVHGRLQAYQRVVQRILTTTPFTVTETMSLFRVLARLYGSSDALRLLDTVALSNSVADRLAVQAGTVLEVPR